MAVLPPLDNPPDIGMDGDFMRLVSRGSFPLRFSLVRLEVLPQEVVPQELDQLITQRHASFNVVSESFMELTTHILSTPQIVVCFLGEPQLFLYRLYTDKLLVRYRELGTILVLLAPSFGLALLLRGVPSVFFLLVEVS